MSDQKPRDLEAEAKELFAAGRAEQPAAAQKERGLDGILSGAAKPRFAPPAKRGGLALIGGGSLLALLLLWGTGGGFGAQLRTSGSPDARPAPRVPTQPVVAEEQPAPPAPAVEVPAPEPQEPQAIPEQPGVPAPPLVKPPGPRREVAAADDADALSRELQMLDRARAELRADPAVADATLAAYRRAFPRGALSTEAEVVQIEALLKLGRRADAESRAKRLLAKEKDGVLGKRVENLLGH